MRVYSTGHDTKTDQTGTAPTDAGNISYLPLDSPDEFTTSAVGTPLDITAYNLPGGFRSTSTGAATAADEPTQVAHNN